jgi:hypothetical protein
LQLFLEVFAATLFALAALLALLVEHLAALVLCFCCW